MKRLLHGMSLGQKTGLLWLVWIGLAAAFSALNLAALSSVTSQARQIYFNRLRPTEELSRASSSLTALRAVLQNRALLNDSGALTHGYIPLLQGRVDMSMQNYFTMYQSSLKQITLRSPGIRDQGQILINREAIALDEWESAWGEAQGLIPIAVQPNPPASLRLTIELKFEAAAEKLNRIEALNESLGLVEIEDATAVASQARWWAVILSILAVAGVLVLGLMQQRLIIRPLTLLTSAADKARRGDLTPRVDVRSQDEIGRLSQTFNSMMSALQDAHLRLTGQNLALQDHARALEALAAAETAQREAESEASRLKSEFLANMSHELRTPMNSVIGYSQVLLEEMDGPLQTEQKQDVQRILAAGHHLLGLINDILDLSKIESGKMAFELESFSLASVVDSAVSTVETLAIQKNIRLFTTIPTDLPPVYADPGKVRQVLLNLLSNAIKFTSEGSVEVAAYPGDRCVAFEVRDTGIGIPESARDYIFEEFRQVDGSTARKFGGTGLGLAISRKLLRLQGGDVVVVSHEGQGSTFRATLPIGAEELPGRLEAADTPDSLPPGSVRPKALCVDDDPGSLNLLSRHLAAAGYEIFTASSADEGLRVARRDRPDLITMDIMMPEKDGWQALEELKSDPDLSRIPVLIVSIVDNRQLAVALGAAGTVPKPIIKAVLLAELERAREDGRPSEVLVVDDDAESCTLVMHALEEAHYRAQFALTGEEALKTIQENPPDAIVLDLKMPNVDGFEVIRRLQQQQGSPPVVILTALDLTPMQREQIARGIVDVVEKGPYSRARLLEAVDRAVEGGQGRPEQITDNSGDNDEHNGGGEQAQ